MTHLTPAEAASPVWQKVSRLLEARLEQLRRQNDADMTQEATWKLRGQIAEVKRLIRMEDDKPTIQ